MNYLDAYLPILSRNMWIKAFCFVGLFLFIGITNLSAFDIPSIPIVKIDGGGNIVAVWSVQKPSNRVIMAATKPAGGAWTAPVTISTALVDSFDPELTVQKTASGNAVATWLAFDTVTQTNQLYAAKLPFGGSWSVPVLLSVPLLEHVTNNDKLEIDASGNLVSVWNSVILATGVIATFVSSATFGPFVWSAPQQLVL